MAYIKTRIWIGKTKAEDEEFVYLCHYLMDKSNEAYLDEEPEGPSFLEFMEVYDEHYWMDKDDYLNAFVDQQENFIEFSFVSIIENDGFDSIKEILNKINSHMKVNIKLCFSGEKEELSVCGIYKQEYQFNGINREYYKPSNKKLEHEIFLMCYNELKELENGNPVHLDFNNWISKVTDNLIPIKTHN